LKKGVVIPVPVYMVYIAPEFFFNRRGGPEKAGIIHFIQGKRRRGDEKSGRA
jgi:hypothetical protein